MFGCRVWGTLDVAEMISLAHLRQLPDDILRESIEGLRVQLWGGQFTPAQAAAWQVSGSALETQYRRAGFSSQAEFEHWCAEETRSQILPDAASLGTNPGDRDRGGGQRRTVPDAPDRRSAC
jgi:hypothetical protein